MLTTEYFMTRSDGVRLVRTYSLSGKLIERDGEMYSEAIDPAELGRVYTETDIDDPDKAVTAEEAISIITGGEV